MAGTSARAEERVNAQLRVRIKGGGPHCDAVIQDASPRGLLLSASPPPQRGEIVEVFIGDQVVVGQVRWARENRFGLKLGDRIDVRALISGFGGPVKVSAIAAAQAPQVEEEEPAGFAYNFVFFVAAAIASLGFLLAAANGGLG